MVNQIILNKDGNTYIGGLATQYSYNKELRESLTKIESLPDSCENFYFVLEGGITRAAQRVFEEAMKYMKPNRILVVRGGDSALDISFRMGK